MKDPSEWFQKVHTVLVVLLMVSLTACSISSSNSMKSNAGDTALENFLKANCDYVHRMHGFYIVGSAKKPNTEVTNPPETTAKEIWKHSIRLFSNFLDADEDGQVDSDKKQLSQWLAKSVLFVIGHLSFVDKISLSKELENRGLYGMSMQTDNWPYVESYNGTGWSIKKLASSTWRPEKFNALWEETFHTVTEAISRSDAAFRFTPGGLLRKYMDDDIAAKTYDISEQNRAENGEYDRVTAVNEYIHQIWAIHFAGQTSKLNVHQKKALAFMMSKGVPMTLNPAYSKTIGTTLK